MAGLVVAPVCTWTASPRCVPPPIAGRGSPIDPASPPQSDMRTVLESGNGPVACGIVIPFVQAQVLSAFRTRHHYTLQVGLKSFVSWTLAPATLRSGVRLPRRPGCSSCSRLCPGRWGCVLAHRVRPFPVHAYILLSGQPRCPPALHTPPSAGRSLFSQLPWSTGNRRK